MAVDNMSVGLAASTFNGICDVDSRLPCFEVRLGFTMPETVPYGRHTGRCGRQ
jgi:hypothetical protein